MSRRVQVRFLMLIVLIGVFLWQRARHTSPLEPGAPARELWAPGGEPAGSVRVALPAPRPASAPASLPLDSPQSTLSTQLALLERGDLAELRRTFTVPVDQAQLDACRKRMHGARVSPDWEMAEERREDGHHVISVSILGKGMTGFHDLGGRFLADRLWCLPNY